MAYCVKELSVYTPTGTSGSAASTLKTVLAPDLVTPVASCNLLLISSVEYQDLSHGYIPDKATAETIAQSLILLMVIAVTWRWLIRSLHVGDYTSDEKH